MPWGEILRIEREKLGYSLEKVEEETKIRKYYLEMMENDDFASLPPRVYATGFVKKYARLLNLDEQEMVSEFKRLAYGGVEQPEESIIVHTNVVNPKHKFSWKSIGAAILFLVLVLWAGNYLVGYFAANGIKDLIPKNEVKKEVQPVKQQEKTSVNNSRGVKLEIAVLRNCWLLIIVDGVSQYEGILKSGEKRSYEGKKSIYLKAGNAGGIEITYNGVKQPPLGNPGEVKGKEYLAGKMGSGQE